MGDAPVLLEGWRVYERTMVQRNRETLPAGRTRPPHEVGSEKRHNLFTVQKVTYGLCSLCDGRHGLACCQKFNDLPTQARWRVVERKRLFSACLRPGHASTKCDSPKECGIEGCSASHNHLLHVIPDANKTISVGLCNSTSQVKSGTSLGVVPVRMKGPHGGVLTYALLDSGSDVTLVERDLLNEVGLTGASTILNLSTVSGTATVEAESLRIELESVGSGETVAADQAFSIRFLPVRPPVASPTKRACQYSHLKDTTFVELSDKHVRLLIGEHVPEAHWPMEKKLDKQRKPYAVKTPLRWVLLGPLSVGHRVWRQVHHVSMKDDDITAHLKALYEAHFHDLEAPGICQIVEDKEALRMVEGSLVFKDGHYEVPLLWRTAERLPDNYRLAHCRLQ
ncbi:hypothetical protein CRM22_001737 [Opisthorchis felineus]|uniref:Peptidase A2 domain-containing protein n=1 Tax=Opisthorchis felineus TaxID=147828 RepID=A0A4V3SGN7_OPIFE|nr:hypothetical protein CRM22_001737 [Opisthorchis felineus]